MKYLGLHIIFKMLSQFTDSTCATELFL